MARLFVATSILKYLAGRPRLHPDAANTVSDNLDWSMIYRDQKTHTGIRFSVSQGIVADPMVVFVDICRTMVVPDIVTATQKRTVLMTIMAAKNEIRTLN